MSSKGITTFKPALANLEDRGISDELNAVKNIAPAIAALKQGLEEENYDAVMAALASVSRLSLDGLRQVRRERMLQVPRFVGKEGFALMAKDIWVDSAVCSVFARQCEDGRRTYLLTGYFGENDWRVIGTSATAPNSAMIGKCLFDAGLLQTRPRLGCEWGININGVNPYDVNFPAKELRDCAFDELVLDGKLSSRSCQGIYFFQTDANGAPDYDQGSYVETEEWAEKRGISLPEDGNSVAAAAKAERLKG